MRLLIRSSAGKYVAGRGSTGMTALRLAELTRDITTVVLPSLSPTMETGVIAEWRVKPGDVLHAGDIMCDINTDKASVGFEVLQSMICARIIFLICNRC